MWVPVLLPLLGPRSFSPHFSLSLAVGSNLAEHLDEDLNELGIDGCEAHVRVGLRGKKEEKKRNGEREKGSVRKGEEER
jgi:hypothetical protein